MRRICALLLAFLSVLLSLWGCGTAESEDDGQLHIIATSFPPYDFARAVAGENARVDMLLAPGTETHTYDPTPRDIRALQQCDILIYGGGESDAWMDTILASLDTGSVTVLAMTALVPLLEEETKEGMSEGGHDHAGEMGQIDEYDEHVFTSPANAAQITADICDAMCRLDPDHAEYYRKNADGYIGQIKSLSTDFADMITDSRRRTVVFADRFPFLYFVREFDLEYYAAFPGCAENTEPGAQTIRYLIDKVKAECIPAVFYTEFSNRRLADSISESTGVQTLLFHSTHNVSKSDFDAGVTYVSLMRQNLENLRKALN